MQEKEVFFTDNFYPKAQSIEIKRLIYAVEHLIKSGECRSFKDIAEKAGFSSQDFTDLKTGRKALQLNFLDSISNISSINKLWVLSGEGEMFKKIPQTTTPQIEVVNEQQLDKFLEALERKDKQIEKRDEQIDRLITLLENERGISSNGDKQSKGA